MTKARASTRTPRGTSARSRSRPEPDLATPGVARIVTMQPLPPPPQSGPPPGPATPPGLPPAPPWPAMPSGTPPNVTWPGGPPSSWNAPAEPRRPSRRRWVIGCGLLLLLVIVGIGACTVLFVELRHRPLGRRGVGRPDRDVPRVQRQPPGPSSPSRPRAGSTSPMAPDSRARSSSPRSRGPSLRTSTGCWSIAQATSSRPTRPTAAPDAPARGRALRSDHGTGDRRGTTDPATQIDRGRRPGALVRGREVAPRRGPRSRGAPRPRRAPAPPHRRRGARDGRRHGRRRRLARSPRSSPSPEAAGAPARRPAVARPEPRPPGGARHRSTPTACSSCPRTCRRVGAAALAAILAAGDAAGTPSVVLAPGPTRPWDQRPPPRRARRHRPGVRRPAATWPPRGSRRWRTRPSSCPASSPWTSTRTTCSPRRKCRRPGRRRGEHCWQLSGRAGSILALPGLPEIREGNGSLAIIIGDAIEATEDVLPLRRQHPGGDVPEGGLEGRGRGRRTCGRSSPGPRPSPGPRRGAGTRARSRSSCARRGGSCGCRTAS